MKVLFRFFGILLLMVLGAEVAHHYTGFIKDGHWTIVYFLICVMSGLGTGLSFLIEANLPQSGTPAEIEAMAEAKAKLAKAEGELKWARR
jgi:hypothetical protein